MKKSLVGALALLLTTAPAFAHHPLAGQPMETFSQGLLSGIGHPLLGFDHLFFVIAMGVAALYTCFARSAPVAYIIAMLIGCLMMANGIGLPMKEAVIGLSLLAVGYIILSGRALSMTLALPIFAIFGLFHGSAFGDTLASQEAATGGFVLLGYLAGLGAIQYAIALAAGWVVKNVFKATQATAMNARLTGALIAGMGVFLTLETIEGAAFAALGLG